MLKATRSGLLVLGLNTKEVSSLREGRSVMVSLDDVGLPGQTVMLFVGSTDEEMRARFIRSGLAEPETPGRSLIDMSKVRL